ncbi:hypothetical protein L218DRAFT_296627 [Marasmius fiardii PR-910]|nr:hypothetical protein L218DRAFT_296627 [Marasmius fiardii PR-910]
MPLSYLKTLRENRMHTPSDTVGVKHEKQQWRINVKNDRVALKFREKRNRTGQGKERIDGPHHRRGNKAISSKARLSTDISKTQDPLARYSTRSERHIRFVDEVRPPPKDEVLASELRFSRNSQARSHDLEDALPPSPRVRRPQFPAIISEDLATQNAPESIAYLSFTEALSMFMLPRQPDDLVPLPRVFFQHGRSRKPKRRSISESESKASVVSRTEKDRSGVDAADRRPKSILRYPTPETRHSNGFQEL